MIKRSFSLFFFILNNKNEFYKKKRKKIEKTKPKKNKIK